jgi:hypothetical protein
VKPKELSEHEKRINRVFMARSAIPPNCGECGTSIDTATVAETLLCKMGDNSYRVIGLCYPCLESLDAADREETVKRLVAIRKKCFV